MLSIEKSIKLICRSETCVTCPLLHEEAKKMFDKERQKNYKELSRLKQSYIRFSNKNYSGLCLNQAQRMEMLKNIDNQTIKIKNELEKITMMKKSLIKNLKLYSQNNNFKQEDTKTKYHTDSCFFCRLMHEYKKRLKKNYKRKKPVELIYYKYLYDRYAYHMHLPSQTKILSLQQIQAVIEKREEETKH